MSTKSKYDRPEAAEIKKVDSGDNCVTDDLPDFGETTVKRIRRKIDKRVIPILTILYVFSFLDRSNIGNAKIAGMTEDLELKGNQYNLALTVFFFPYAFFEVPSNIILKLMRPSRWIAIMVLSWGTVMTLQGIVQNYNGLLATRFMLGLAESGFFPAASFLLSTWYCRFEIQTRMAIFFSSASFASAFSGLLAFAIQNMDGVAGLGGWRWIFILEGVATVAIGGVLSLLLPDSPETARFLTEEERGILLQRLQSDSGTVSSGEAGEGRQPFRWKYLKSSLSDWKIYLAVIIYWGNSMCLYGFNYTAPTIIRELGYSAANAQLLTVPVYTLGVLTTLAVSVLSDRMQTRWPFIVGPYTFSLLAFVGLLAVPHPSYPGLTYGLLFLIPGGGYPPLLTCLAWLSNNISPSWKRAISLGMFIGMGNLGGTVGSNIFPESHQPNYWLGYAVCLGITAAAIGSTLVLKVAYERLNREKERIPLAERERDEGEGNDNPNFRYVL